MIVSTQLGYPWEALHRRLWYKGREIYAMADHMSQTIRYWVPVILYAGLIFYLSSLPHPEQYAPFWLRALGDKMAHALEYGVLGILCYRAFRHAAGTWGVSYALSLAIAVSIAYGLTDELHQAFVPFREPDGWDLFMDALGSSVAVLARTVFIRP